MDDDERLSAKYPKLAPELYPCKEGNTVPLSDGRVLGYKEYRGKDNDTSNLPVITLFPGIPGTRLFSHPLIEAGDFSGYRFIVLERPGFGLSTAKRGRNIKDWVNDVLEFMDYMKIEKMSVIGYSAGGPYALAVAHAIPHRLNKVALISSISPREAQNVYAGMPWLFKIAWFCTAYAPSVVRYFASKINRDEMLYDPVRFHRADFDLSPKCDVEVLLQPDVEYMFCASTMEIYSRSQMDIESDEYALWGRDWGFNLREIKAEVSVWQGALDPGTTVPMAEYIAKKIDCPLIVKYGQGHMLYFSMFEQITRWLLVS
ncbi:hypothetical protein HDV06_005879 [Boothiomyces sp. JEL0866]|nr:hypothetical protein HDV06_005879 [Boothiomyces sp. JEL0866]